MSGEVSPHRAGDPGGMEAEGEHAAAPLATVVVCTRNRRDNVVPTLRSTVECPHTSASAASAGIHH